MEDVVGIMRNHIHKCRKTGVVSHSSIGIASRRRWCLRELTRNRNIGVVEASSLPGKPVSPGRFLIVVAGIAVGANIGVLAAFVRRRPPRWSLATAGFGTAGAALATGIAVFAEVSGCRAVDAAGNGGRIGREATAASGGA